jgi:hypothetical protein
MDTVDLPHRAASPLVGQQHFLVLCFRQPDVGSQAPFLKDGLNQ